MKRAYLSKYMTIDEQLARLKARIEHTADKNPLQEKIDYLRARKEIFGRQSISKVDLDLLSIIATLRFAKTCLTVKLADIDFGWGEKRLKSMYHKGLINRVRETHNSEFAYYIEKASTLDLICQSGTKRREELPYGLARYNREANYAKAKLYGEDGKILFLRHEIKVGRDIGLILLAAKHRSKPRVEITEIKSGPHAPMLSVEAADPKNEHKTITLKLQPDAYIRFHFPNREQEDFGIFLEIDRQTESMPVIMDKVRFYHHYNKAKKHKQDFNIPSIKAVCFDTETRSWAEEMARCAQALSVAKGLFYFTSSQFFEDKSKAKIGGKIINAPNYLRHPGVFFDPIWASPKTFPNKLHSLLDQGDAHA